MNIEKIKTKLRNKCNESRENKLKLAKSTYTPKDILEDLCDSEDIEINSELLENEKVKEELRKKAEITRNKIEKKIIEKAANSEESRYEIANMEKLIYDKHTSGETLTVLYEYIEEIIDNLLAGLFIESDYEDERMNYGPEEFEEFINNKRELCRKQIQLEVIEAFIINPNTPKEIVEKIITDMKHTPVEKIYKKYYDASGERIERQEKRTPEEKEAAEKLLNDWYEEDYNIIKENRYFEDPEMAEYYAELAKNPYTPKEILEKIIELDFRDFSVELLSNSSLTYEMILKVAENNGYGIENKFVALALAKNPETPDNVIEKLEESEHIEVLLALLEREGKGKKFSEKVVLDALKSGVANEDISYVEQTTGKEQENNNTLIENKGEEINE